MHILLVDNYDSFTWNLYRLLQHAGAKMIVVKKNDELKNADISQADALVFSPGPALPAEAGDMEEIIKTHAGKKKMLGICLGHQAIGEVFGAKLIRAHKIYHGEQTELFVVKPDILFENLPPHSSVGRYHSWIIDKNNFPRNLEIIATDTEESIMAIRHKNFDIKGVQFHPESIMTPAGLQMIKNWIFK